METTRTQQDAHVAPARDRGGLILAAILIVAGAYFLLRDTFGLSLPDLDWSRAWPVVVILLGVVSLIRGWTGHTHRHRRDRPG